MERADADGISRAAPAVQRRRRGAEQTLPVSAGAASQLFTARPQPGHAHQQHPPQTGPGPGQRHSLGSGLGQGLSAHAAGALMYTRHSLFWKLAALVISFCLAMIGVSHVIGERINRQTSYLSEQARDALL